eukprot:CAMPEP_0181389780 /NCGR_PEP_ID=MMETSP1106-20121128/25098_1 /TAXON_ID=81844 /ORGANISM="Mantoniella antarctica, Strain SL-175" /LENGTH=71 /DNA_ID=CAMNT_0023510575 /DNA_START=175 /DNA_END=390 /DNA_ORIENTATION=+
MVLTLAQEWAHWYMLHGHMYGLWFAGGLFCVFILLLGYERALIRWGQLSDYFERKSVRIKADTLKYKKKRL